MHILSPSCIRYFNFKSLFLPQLILNAYGSTHSSELVILNYLPQTFFFSNMYMLLNWVHNYDFHKGCKIISLTWIFRFWLACLWCHIKKIEVWTVMKPSFASLEKLDCLSFSCWEKCVCLNWLSLELQISIMNFYFYVPGFI